MNGKHHKIQLKIAGAVFLARPPEYPAYIFQHLLVVQIKRVYLLFAAKIGVLSAAGKLLPLGMLLKKARAVRRKQRRKP